MKAPVKDLLLNSHIQLILDMIHHASNVDT